MNRGDDEVRYLPEVQGVEPVLPFPRYDTTKTHRSEVYTRRGRFSDSQCRGHPSHKQTHKQFNFKRPRHPPALVFFILYLDRAAVQLYVPRPVGSLLFRAYTLEVLSSNTILSISTNLDNNLHLIIAILFGDLIPR